MVASPVDEFETTCPNCRKDFDVLATDQQARCPHCHVTVQLTEQAAPPPVPAPSIPPVPRATAPAAVNDSARRDPEAERDARAAAKEKARSDAAAAKARAEAERQSAVAEKAKTKELLDAQRARAREAAAQAKAQRDAVAAQARAEAQTAKQAEAAQLAAGKANLAQAKREAAEKAVAERAAAKAAANEAKAAKAGAADATPDKPRGFARLNFLTRRERTAPDAREAVPIIKLEGVGPVFAAKLEKVGIKTSDDLLAADPDDLVKRTKISKVDIRKWQDMADLVHVSGIGPQYAEVLVRCDINSVAELARQEAKPLAQRIQALIASKQVTIIGTGVNEKRAKAWIAEARKLAPPPPSPAEKALKSAQEEDRAPQNPLLTETGLIEASSFRGKAFRVECKRCEEAFLVADNVRRGNCPYCGAVQPLNPVGVAAPEKVDPKELAEDARHEAQRGFLARFSRREVANVPPAQVSAKETPSATPAAERPSLFGSRGDPDARAKRDAQRKAEADAKAQAKAQAAEQRKSEATRVAAEKDAARKLAAEAKAKADVDRKAEAERAKAAKAGVLLAKPAAVAQAPKPVKEPKPARAETSHGILGNRGKPVSLGSADSVAGPSESGAKRFTLFGGGKALESVDCAHCNHKFTVKASQRKATCPNCHSRLALVADDEPLPLPARAAAAAPAVAAAKKSPVVVKDAKGKPAKSEAPIIPTAQGDKALAAMAASNAKADAKAAKLAAKQAQKAEKLKAKADATLQAKKGMQAEQDVGKDAKAQAAADAKAVKAKADAKAAKFQLKETKNAQKAEAKQAKAKAKADAKAAKLAAKQDKAEAKPAKAEKAAAAPIMLTEKAGKKRKQAEADVATAQVEATDDKKAAKLAAKEAKAKVKADAKAEKLKLKEAKAAQKAQANEAKATEKAQAKEAKAKAKADAMAAKLAAKAGEADAKPAKGKDATPVVLAEKAGRKAKVGKEPITEEKPLSKTELKAQAKAAKQAEADVATAQVEATDDKKAAKLAAKEAKAKAKADAKAEKLKLNEARAAEKSKAKQAKAKAKADAKAAKLAAKGKEPEAKAAKAETKAEAKAAKEDKAEGLSPRQIAKLENEKAKEGERRKRAVAQREAEQARLAGAENAGLWAQAVARPLGAQRPEGVWGASVEEQRAKATESPSKTERKEALQGKVRLVDGRSLFARLPEDKKDRSPPRLPDGKSPFTRLDEDKRQEGPTAPRLPDGRSAFERLPEDSAADYDRLRVFGHKPGKAYTTKGGFHITEEVIATKAASNLELGTASDRRALRREAKQDDKTRREQERQSRKDAKEARRARLKEERDAAVQRRSAKYDAVGKSGEGAVKPKLFGFASKGKAEGGGESAGKEAEPATVEVKKAKAVPSESTKLRQATAIEPAPKDEQKPRFGLKRKAAAARTENEARDDTARLGFFERRKQAADEKAKTKAEADANKAQAKEDADVAAWQVAADKAKAKAAKKTAAAKGTQESTEDAKPSGFARLNFLTRRERTAPDAREAIPVLEFEGVGPTFAAKLQKAGIHTSDDLLAADADELAKRAKIPKTEIRKWQDMADLLHINGIGPQFAEVLVRSDINSVAELARQDPKALAQRIQSFVDSKQITIVGTTVTEKRTKQWVAAARKMAPPSVSAGEKALETAQKDARTPLAVDRPGATKKQKAQAEAKASKPLFGFLLKRDSADKPADDRKAAKLAIKEAKAAEKAKDAEEKAKAKTDADAAKAKAKKDAEEAKLAVKQAKQGPASTKASKTKAVPEEVQADKATPFLAVFSRKKAEEAKRETPEPKVEGKKGKGKAEPVAETAPDAAPKLDFAARRQAFLANQAAKRAERQKEREEKDRLRAIDDARKAEERAAADAAKALAKAEAEAGKAKEQEALLKSKSSEEKARAKAEAVEAKRKAGEEKAAAKAKADADAVREAAKEEAARRKEEERARFAAERATAAQEKARHKEEARLAKEAAKGRPMASQPTPLAAPAVDDRELARLKRAEEKALARELKLLAKRQKEAEKTAARDAARSSRTGFERGDDEPAPAPVAVASRWARPAQPAEEPAWEPPAASPSAAASLRATAPAGRNGKTAAPAKPVVRKVAVQKVVTKTVRQPVAYDRAAIDAALRAHGRAPPGST